MRRSKQRNWMAVVIVLTLALVLSGCGATAEPTQPPAQATPVPTPEPMETTAPPEPTAPPETGFQIPDIQEGKFNVAMVLIGPHNDGGWSEAHYEGLEWIQANMADVHTAYIENVPEGTDSEQVFRSLSRKGFDLIFGTSFGFMDPMETVAAEFPDTTYQMCTTSTSAATSRT
jgi:basic membrane protein A